MRLSDLIRRNEKVRCYPYCIGLKYDRSLEKTKRQWERTNIYSIAQIIIEDLKKLKIPSKIVYKTYTPSCDEKLLALRVSILWQGGDYLHDVDYHIIVKRQDGYWYSKFYELPPEQLPKDIDIEAWSWRDSNRVVHKGHYNSEIVYIAVKC